MGSSDRNVPDVSLDRWIDDLEAVVRANNLGSFVLAGVDCGAATALAYAARNPERVDHLVLMNGFTNGAGRWLDNPVSQSVRALIQSGLPSQNWDFFRLTLGNLVTRLQDADEARHLADVIRNATSPLSHQLGSAAMQLIDVSRDVPSVKAPTLVVHDKNFPFASLEACRDLASGIADAQMVVIDGDGDAEIAAIDTFLRSRGASSVAAEGAASAGAYPNRLSAREVEVLRLIAAGKSNQQIADELVISPNTVLRHVSNIFAKAGLSNRAEAATYAVRHRLA
jgi:DNA-binding CsgD family transcriptional regulator/pimeloyl-ACP methyl ester carboxylesterase